MRETFQLFALYETEKGISGLLDRIDSAGVGPDQICRAVFGRSPKTPEEGVPSEAYDSRERLEAALLSSEFQTQIVANLLVAYPEQQREVFIHIPKCAGTDLILNVGQRREMLPLPVMLGDERWISKAELFDTLHGLVQLIPYHDRFFVYGHNPLEEYVRTAGARGTDKIFTVLRDPVDLLISQANYAITRLRQDPGGSQPDAREVLSVLGIERLPEPIALADLKAMALRLLLEPRIVQPNPLCFYLGGPEKSARYEQAMANIVAYDVEVTTTRHYPSWLRRRWRIVPNSRHNQSDHWIDASDLGPQLRGALQDFIAEDRELFDVVSAMLERGAAASLAGSQIARILSGRSFAASAEHFRPEQATLPAEATESHQPPEPTVVQGRDAILALLQDQRHSDPALAVDFGLQDGGRGYLRDGWAIPEPHFTWTAAAVCSLELPKPTALGDYRLRLICGPFIAKERLPNQRITLAANGIVLGTATAKERSVIEWELPRIVLGGQNTTTFTFWLPDAARPRELSAGDDERLLGFAVERIELLLVREERSQRLMPHIYQSKDAIAKHLHGTSHLEPVLRLGFGSGQDSELLLRDGWGIPEKRFTWTSARRANCETAIPVPVDDYRLRIKIGR